MDYADAKKIRGQSFGSRMADKLTEGQGIGASIKATLSEGSKARMTGIKEKFDPMNIGKFFGGKLGASLVGKITGRSKQDMEYFAGKKSSTKIGKLESGNEMVDMLMKIYSLMQKTNEDNKKMRDDENKFKEEKEMERLRRHKELIEAITGKPYTGKASVVKNEEGSNPLMDFLGDLYKMKDIFTLLKSSGSWLGTILSGPFALAAALSALIIGGAALLGDKISNDAGEVGGLAASEAESQSQTESYLGAGDPGALGGAIMNAGEESTGDKRSKIIKEFQEDRSKFLQSKGYKKTGSRRVGAFEEYTFTDAEGNPPSPELLKGAKIYAQEEQNKRKIKLEESPTTSVSPTGSESSPTPSPSASPSTQSSPSPSASPVTQSSPSASPAGSESSPTPTAMAQSVPSPNSGQQLNQVQGENLTAKVQETLSKGETVVNNSAISKSLSSNDTRGPLPPVRNHEETFAKMIFDSTRVV